MCVAQFSVAQNWAALSFRCYSSCMFLRWGFKCIFQWAFFFKCWNTITFSVLVAGTALFVVQHVKVLPQLNTIVAPISICPSPSHQDIWLSSTPIHPQHTFKSPHSISLLFWLSCPYVPAVWKYIKLLLNQIWMVCPCVSCNNLTKIRSFQAV